MWWYLIFLISVVKANIQMLMFEGNYRMNPIFVRKNLNPLDFCVVSFVENFICSVPVKNGGENETFLVSFISVTVMPNYLGRFLLRIG